MEQVAGHLLYALSSSLVTGFVAWAVLGRKQAYLEGQISALKDVPVKLGGLETRVSVAENDLNHLHQRVRELSPARRSERAT